MLNNLRRFLLVCVIIESLVKLELLHVLLVLDLHILRNVGRGMVLMLSAIIVLWGGTGVLSAFVRPSYHRLNVDYRAIPL